MLPLVDSPENVLELARACEKYVVQALGFQLDYTIETLPVLDQYTREVKGPISARPELLPLLGHAVGAYFGEVLCRSASAFWRLPSTNVVDWQVCMRQTFLWFNPIGAAYDALTAGNQHDGPSSQLRVAPEDRSLVQARLERLEHVPEDEYFLLSTRVEVIELVCEELCRQMEERGYSDTTFDESDYEAEQSPVLL